MTVPNNLLLDELLKQRVSAAAELQAAIAAVRPALTRFTELGRELGARLGDGDLARRVETPIALHLMQAGLVEWLERKLQGTAPDLQAVVERQHELLAAKIARVARADTLL